MSIAGKPDKIHYIFQFKIYAFIERCTPTTKDETIQTEGHGCYIANPAITSSYQVCEKIRDEIANWKKFGKSYRINPRISIVIFNLHARDSELMDDQEAYTFIHDETFAESERKLITAKNPQTSLQPKLETSTNKVEMSMCRNWERSICKLGDRCLYKHG